VFAADATNHEAKPSLKKTGIEPPPSSPSSSLPTRTVRGGAIGRSKRATDVIDDDDDNVNTPVVDLFADGVDANARYDVGGDGDGRGGALDKSKRDVDAVKKSPPTSVLDVHNERG
jgi:hypothetical protein